MSTKASDSVLDTLADLVRINSVNPSYEGGVDELELAQYVEAFFADRGIDTYRQVVFPNRPNVVARVAGADPGRRIVLEAHMDTVSAAGMSIEPWKAEIKSGKLYGRGACDTKAGLAAMMHAVASLVEQKLTPNCEVMFAATVDEEYSYRGVVALCESDFRADVAIVAEPTGLQAVIASKGLVRWKIEARGKAAHSAKPHLGVNAIVHMAKVIMAIQQDTLELTRIEHRLLGPATCNVGLVRGGVQINFVPDRCEIEIDRRLLPDETIDSVLAHYQTLVDSVTKDDPTMQVVMHHPMLTDRPLETDASSLPVQTMVDVLRRLGLDATLIGVPFCSDASKFGAIGIPSMILGPGSIDQAHAAIEFVDCDQVIRAVDIYRQFIFAFQPPASET